ncbi:hypothetical protein PMAYCL1PPCAC_21962, partial [Pristionchus mayeri]
SQGQANQVRDNAGCYVLLFFRDLTGRAEELSDEEIEKITTAMLNPTQYKIPDWFLNIKKDYKGGKTAQVLSTGMDNKWREELERLKKICFNKGVRAHRLSLLQPEG